jgi:secondary thiamine-phosphate synthase enzyme
MMNNISIETPHGESLTDITAQVREFVTSMGVEDGICICLVPHTTAAITVNSALDNATLDDLVTEMGRLVPKRVDFAHQYDTPADAAGHVKAALVGHNVTLFIADGKLLLGGSQSVLFFEFDGPRTRTVQVKVIAG